MGLFDKLFGNTKKATPAQANTYNVRLRFEIFTVNIENLPFEITLNLDLKDRATREKFDWL